MSAARAGEVEPSLRRAIASGSIVRFGGILVAAALMAATSVVAARALGPTGKGTLSALSYLTALGAVVVTLGLGEAAMVLRGTRGWPLSAAGRPLLMATLAAGGCGAAVVLGLGAVLVASAAAPVLPVVLLAALAVVPSSLVTNLMRLSDAHGRMTYSTVAYVAFAASTTAATVLLVAMFDLGLRGALVAALVGPMVGAALLLHDLAAGGRLAPSEIAAPQFLRASLPVGLPLMAATALRALSRRIDLLVVFALAGAAQAGQYSVALTVGELAMYAPGALAASMFPRLAALDEGGVGEVVAELARVSVVAAGLVAVVVGAVIPVALPRLFGAGFAGAVVPAVVLLGGGVCTSFQWVVSRAAGALGHPQVVIRSFLLSTATMLALDFAFVPELHASGAAIAAVIGPAAGCLLCLHDVRHRGVASLPRGGVLPRASDVSTVVSFAIREARRLGRAAAGLQ